MEKIHNSTKTKIVALLLENKSEQMTIRAIAHSVGVDYKSVHITVNRLIDSGTINAKKAGQTILCSIREKAFSTDIFMAEYSRREKLLGNKDFYALQSYFNDIKEPFFTLLLFGSHALGKAKKGSDIDLMLISDNEEIRKKASKIVSQIPLEIHLSDFSSQEFLSMIKTTEFNVGKEAMNNNIILFGIEDYYRLIQNA